MALAYLALYFNGNVPFGLFMIDKSYLVYVCSQLLYIKFPFVGWEISISRARCASSASAPQKLHLIREVEMSRKTLILDGFWYCLRPSFTLTSHAHREFSFGSRKPLSKRHNPPTLPTGQLKLPPRRYHYSTLGEAVNHNEGKDANHNVGSEDLPLEEQEALEETDQEDQPHDDQPQDETPEHSPAARQSTTDGTLRRRRRDEVDSIPYLRPIPTSSLEPRLQAAADRAPDLARIMRILHVLIRERHICPEVRHYRALILANCDPRRGSADQVRGLLAEMEPNGIPIDSGTLHAALQVRIS